MGWGTFSRSINDTNQSRKGHWDLRIETGGHLFKEEMGASFDFWFCRFHCVLYRGYVSSVASAVSPALQLQIADSTIPSGLGLIDCVQLFLDDWRQSTSLSSYQMPLKNYRGLDSDWLVSLNTFSQNPLILKLELFRSKSVSDMDFPIISENWVCRFLANYLLDIMQCKLEMAWGFFSNAHIRLSLFIKTFSAETCPHIRKVEYPHIYVQNTLQLPSKISIFVPKALFLAPKMIF